MGETTATTSQTSLVTADMRWKIATEPPQVTLTFEGLQPPLQLLSELSVLGWTVPAPPAPPGSSIEWVPDPVAGTEHTVHPWRVVGFELAHGAWGSAVAPAIGSLTYDVLRRNGAEVRGKSNTLKLLEDSWQEPGVVAKSAEPAPTGQSSDAPRIVLVNYQGSPLEGLTHAEGVTGGRKKISTPWAQSELVLGSLCPTEEVRSQLLIESTQSWLIEPIDAPSTTKPGHVSVCALIPGKDPSDKKIQKFVAALGGTLSVGKATPLDGRADHVGSLVFGAVAGNSFELVTSNLRVRFPDAVLRQLPS